MAARDIKTLRLGKDATVYTHGWYGVGDMMLVSIHGGNMIISINDSTEHDKYKGALHINIDDFNALAELIEEIGRG